ncbi:hypothetical protein [Xanthomonas sp. 10-10]|uniref:Uncharacterized protein n=1 Tax=Xanthomonas sp. 10-10 TaxID=3115848 RepID=A0AAU7P969_9XANT
MHRFDILANSVLIGHTAFESGDPPMGAAFGRFIPIATYSAVQPAITQYAGREVAGINLAVRVASTKQLIQCLAVSITDCSSEFGAEDLEVAALGIGYPLYAELFPHHVDAYENQFN